MNCATMHSSRESVAVVGSESERCGGRSVEAQQSDADDQLMAECEFLADYAGHLLGCGATCIRIEKNVGRIARTWRRKVVMNIMPRHVHLSLIEEDGRGSRTIIAPMGYRMISFDLNTQLSRLSWAIADNGLSLDEARKEFGRIVTTRPANRWWVLFAATLANSAFCELFGGDIVAMLVVALSTLCGYYLKQVLVKAKVDPRAVFAACAFVSSVLAAADGLFGLGSTPYIAVATSVLYLVPGIPFLNSFSDMLTSDYVCSYSRMVDAVVLTCCLSLGLCGGMLLMHISMF